MKSGNISNYIIIINEVINSNKSCDSINNKPISSSVVLYVGDGGGEGIAFVSFFNILFLFLLTKKWMKDSI